MMIYFVSCFLIFLGIAYKSEEDQVLAMKYLLGTWEIIINDVKGVFDIFCS